MILVLINAPGICLWIIISGSSHCRNNLWLAAAPVATASPLAHLLAISGCLFSPKLAYMFCQLSMQAMDWQLTAIDLGTQLPISQAYSQQS
ncbi:hypothetical protein ACLKA7_007266 [Drosophila subpalustris]